MRIDKSIIPEKLPMQQSLMVGIRNTMKNFKTDGLELKNDAK